MELYWEVFGLDEVVSWLKCQIVGTAGMSNNVVRQVAQRLTKLHRKENITSKEKKRRLAKETIFTHKD